MSQQTGPNGRTEKITIKPRRNNVDTYIHLVRLFMEKRGSDPTPWGNAPRTTNSEVKQLVDYWHSAVTRSAIERFFKTDKDPASRKRWMEAYKQISAQLRGANPGETYGDNAHFWGATYRVASYLDALAFAPSHLELLGESVKETIVEHKQRIVNAVDKADDLIELVKKGALILAGVVGAAIVIPPVIRAFRDP